MVFIIKGFRTIVFILLVISTFQLICPLAFFRCLANPGTYTQLRTTLLIESTGVTCSDSVSHNRVQVLSIPVSLLGCNKDWTCNLQIIFSIEALGTNAYNHYAMCPAGFNKWRSSKFCIVSRVQQTPEEGLSIYRLKRCGNNNKDEDNSPKTLNDKTIVCLFVLICF